MGGDYTQSDGGDSRLRGFGLTNHRDYPFKVSLRGFHVETGGDGENSQTLIKTPAGNVTTHLYQSTQMASDGISLPFFKYHAVVDADVTDFAISILPRHYECAQPSVWRQNRHFHIESQAAALRRSAVHGPSTETPTH